MTVDLETSNRNYPLPNIENTMAHDVDRLISALTTIDVDVASILTALALKAAIDSPAFSGNPTAPTQPATANNAALATTAHVKAALSQFLSDAEGAIATITELQAALGDADAVTGLTALINTRAPLDSANLTGTPTTVTPDADDNSQKIPTTGWVQAIKATILGGVVADGNTLAKLFAALGGDKNFAASVASDLANKASLANPAFTGNPTAPTQTAGSNNTRLATTAFVATAISNAVASISSAISNLSTMYVPLVRKVSAGVGMTGGGDLSADRTISLGAAKPISNSTTGTVDNTGHDHPLGFVAAEVFQGGAVNEINFPVGRTLLVTTNGGLPVRNTQQVPCLKSDNTFSYVTANDSKAGAVLSGIWFSAGNAAGTSISMVQRAG
ncbi:hypothetical protein FS799_00750 [Agrobacterium vitis]|uniref:hypothetical protein n=1 Tax=Agrobacterium vitis TaxID=373 RepID=UPI001F4307D1|nr:hypothetical protein [Agrobacterium vitis]MCE6073385.1 hypothetical protein [Agrobacterium vitis]